MIRSHQALVFLVNRLAGRLNRRRQQVSDYLLEENRSLRSRLEGKRLRLSDDPSKRARTA